MIRLAFVIAVIIIAIIVLFKKFLEQKRKTENGSVSTETEAKPTESEKEHLHGSFRTLIESFPAFIVLIIALVLSLVCLYCF